MKNIATTGFYTSIISYFAFVFFDYLHPGFVSNIFSVHWFLLPVIVFGILLSASCGGIKGVRPDWIPFLFKEGVGVVIRLIIGLILFIVIWREGEVFGDFRILLSLIGFLIPWIAMRLLRD